MVPWLNVPDILERQRTYDRAQFVNEVLGMPTSLGDHVITREQIEACCQERSFATTLQDISAGIRGPLIAGLDWGGGSESGTSLVIGHLVDKQYFRVVRFDRWPPHANPDQVLREVAERCTQFQVRWVAADGGGNGNVYDRLLFKQLSRDVGAVSLFAILYSETFNSPIPDQGLHRWTVDRTHVIGMLFTRIKDKLLSFPRVAESSSFLHEFTCELFEYDSISRKGKYTKPETTCDDALHATVYAESLALLHAARQWH
jgi:hypothetical protein